MRPRAEHEALGGAFTLSRESPYRSDHTQMERFLWAAAIESALVFDFFVRISLYKFTHSDDFRVTVERVVTRSAL
jgi:hypothetical protein